MYKLTNHIGLEQSVVTAFKLGRLESHIKPISCRSTGGPTSGCTCFHNMYNIIHIMMTACAVMCSRLLGNCGRSGNLTSSQIVWVDSHYFFI